ncbi:phosphatidylinositol-4-phosphate 5-Kinase domain-containing protein [Ditylenchus destructor]|uniref:Phosphatidylinositol-4-phosphate 5-Kinase domain-containing protein n=1 Tax=Ditylenchus destructor TaxID=166010 RepID=A0AAD4NBL0_9BILA|nr:phosphatidylinositol-4-phosphate 5-Kinase domain-containing protein [Ditylenchus destructor]
MPTSPKYLLLLLCVIQASLSPVVASPQNNDTTGKDETGHSTKPSKPAEKAGEPSSKADAPSPLIGAIQLGIANAIELASKKARKDLEIQDFSDKEIVSFPSKGSETTPPHTYGSFRFKAYAPVAFNRFREIFNVTPEEFKKSLCEKPLKALSNSGQSGSIFFLSADDKYIIKTVQGNEIKLLNTMLPVYYSHIQKPQTLLPKFFGLFRHQVCVQTLCKSTRFIVTNNLLPSSLVIDRKYDLKGSKVLRNAGGKERRKSSPTLKDLDFDSEFKSGIYLEDRVYESLMKIIESDSLILVSSNIMDYSILIGIHNIDKCCKEGRQECGAECRNNAKKLPEAGKDETKKLPQPYEELHGLPATNEKGERLLLFVGIIDILQRYRCIRKVQHAAAAIFCKKEEISLNNPFFYSTRFNAYMRGKVFHKASDKGTDWASIHFPSDEPPKDCCEIVKEEEDSEDENGLAGEFDDDKKKQDQ